MNKFRQKKANEDFCLISVNQINSKHVDLSNRGFYEYAPAKLAVIKMHRYTENDETLLIDETILIDGAKCNNGQQSTLKVDHL